MLKVTFDTNCLIDLEEGGSHAQALREIVEFAQSDRIVLRIDADS